MGLTRHSGTEGELLRKHARLWVALAGATVIAGLFVGFGMSNGSGNNQSAKRVGIAARVVGGNQASASTSSGLKSSPAQRTELALPGLTRPLRDMRNVKPGKRHNRSEFSRSRRSGLSESSSRTAAVQTKAGSGQMPAPIQNFEGVSSSAAACRPTPRATSGRTTTCSGSTSTSPSTRRRGRRSVRHCPATPCGPAIRSSHLRRNNNGDPIVLYDQYSGRWFGSQFAFPNFPNGPFYQCVAVSTSNDPSGDLVRLPVHRSATKLNDYPKFGVWPTQNAYMATINQFIAPGFSWGGVGVMAFERDQMIACGPRGCSTGTCSPRRPASGAACSRRTPTARHCRLRMRRRR